MQHQVTDHWDRITFNATGSVRTALSCNTTAWQNANWTMGQIYSSEMVDCAPANFSADVSTVKVSTVKAVS